MLTLWKRVLSLMENLLAALAEHLVIDVCETMGRLVSGHTDAERLMSLVGLLSPAPAEPGCRAAVNIH